MSCTTNELGDALVGGSNLEVLTSKLVLQGERITLPETGGQSFVFVLTLKHHAKP